MTAAERKRSEGRTVRRLGIAIATGSAALTAWLTSVAAAADHSTPLFTPPAPDPAPVAQRDVQEEYVTVEVHVPAPKPTPGDVRATAPWTAGSSASLTAISRPPTISVPLAPAPKPVAVTAGSVVPKR